METLGKQLAVEVEKFVKAKVVYQHRGTTTFGCDCTGLVIGALKNLGYFKTYKLRLYKEDFNLHIDVDDHIKTELEKVADDVFDKPLEVGDIFLFKFARQPAHVGVFLRGNTFAHCYKDAGRCCLAVIEKSPWAKRLMGRYRLNLDKVMKVSNGR